MIAHPLHITNGNILTNYLNELGFNGEKLTWQEMLCEGPTLEEIDSDAFFKLRTDFLNSFYNIDLDVDEMRLEINKLNNTEQYSEIILWFEYDLFCHINMVAVLSLLHKKRVQLPIYLVCSGRIEGEKNLRGLSELSAEQLTAHYKKRIKLSDEDIDLANTVWKIYCGKDHNLLKPYIIKHSGFTYLSNCLKAHLERFPDSKSGLNILEKNILEIIKQNKIKSKHHLLGYALNYQGYYGFSDIQLARIIDNLSNFIIEETHALRLNRKGYEALLDQHNFLSEIDCRMVFGGVNKCDFQFSKQQNKLIKNVMHGY